MKSNAAMTATAFWDAIKDDVVTHTDRSLLVSEIDTLSSAQFYKDHKRHSTITIFEHELPVSEIMAVHSIIDACPIVKIALAYYPPRTHILQFAKLLRAKLDPNCILEITYDPQLIGGATIKYNGTVYDGSVASQLV